MSRVRLTEESARLQPDLEKRRDDSSTSPVEFTHFDASVIFDRMRQSRK